MQFIEAGEEVSIQYALPQGCTYHAQCDMPTSMLPSTVITLSHAVSLVFRDAHDEQGWAEFSIAPLILHSALNVCTAARPPDAHVHTPYATT